jgi:excisionase family DNA binding protein
MTTDERLLTVAEAAEILRTSERFPRRLIAERRIRFIRVGRHVRVPESALREFIAAGVVEPITATRKRDAALWESDDSGGSASCRLGGSKPDSRVRTA